MPNPIWSSYVGLDKDRAAAGLWKALGSPAPLGTWQQLAGAESQLASESVSNRPLGPGQFPYVRFQCDRCRTPVLFCFLITCEVFSGLRVCGRRCIFRHWVLQRLPASPWEEAGSCRWALDLRGSGGCPAGWDAQPQVSPGCCCCKGFVLPHRTWECEAGRPGQAFPREVATHMCHRLRVTCPR